jgi:hypothetical protein
MAGVCAAVTDTFLIVWLQVLIMSRVAFYYLNDIQDSKLHYERRHTCHNKALCGITCVLHCQGSRKHGLQGSGSDFALGILFCPLT